MAKNIIKKITLILLTIIVGFLINNKEVKADYSKCNYASPLSFIDQYNTATKLQVNLSYYHFWNPWGFISLDGTYYTEVLDLDKFLLRTGDPDTSGYLLQVGFHTNPALVDQGEETAINQDTFYFQQDAFGSGGKKFVSNGCPKYVKLTMPSIDANSVVVSEVSETDYVAYVKDSQYRGYTSNSNKLYNLITLKDIKEENYGVLTRDDTTHVASLKDKEEEFKHFVQSTGGIVLVDTSSAPSYPSAALNKYKEMLDYYKKNGKNLTDDQKSEALEGLNTIIGTSSTDDKTYTDKFYEATKDRWYNYMKADLENPRNAEATRKTYFSKWWDLVARYEFETDYANKDMTRFKKFVNYMCENNLVDNYDATKCENIIGIVDSMINYDKADTQQTYLVDNSCNALCNSCIQTSSAYNGSACNECSKGVDYKTCTSCIRNCKNVQSSSSRTDCEKGCMGEELYNTYISEYNEVKDELEQQKQDAAQDAYESSVTLYSLYSVRAPSLDIKFGKEGYKVNCDDIPELHTYYMIIIILAPILVILFGSIDFAKAVIASDEKKMQEFKSKFPKRLGLLVVLIIVPLIIRLILGVTDLDMDLMECVIKGYN